MSHIKPLLFFFGNGPNFLLPSWLDTKKATFLGWPRCKAGLGPAAGAHFLLEILHFYRTQVSLVRSMDLVVSNSLSIPCANLTDVTLADEDTNSILTDNAKRAIQGNVAMHVTLPGGQLWNQCKWCHLVAKFATNASGAIWWPNLQPMQDAPSGGQILN